MTACLALLLSFHTVASADTMLLPIYDGRILRMSANAKTKGGGILISPSKDFSVRSCSEGRVLRVWKTESGWCTTIQSNDTAYTYAQMDTVMVNPGWEIRETDTIGERKMIPNDYKAIIFVVMKGNKILDPEKCILYKKD